MSKAARFYSETRAKRRGTTATKSDAEGLVAHIRGWDIGVEVVIFINDEGDDEIVIRPTGGSNKPTPGEIVYQDSLTKELAPLVQSMQEIHIRLPKKTKIKLDQTN